MRRSGTNGRISWKNNRLKDLESIPDVRDGLTYTERIILYVLQETQHEVNGRNVPTAMLYGRVVEYVNPAFEQLTGLSSADIIGQRARKVLPVTRGRRQNTVESNEDGFDWVAAYSETVRQGKIRRFEQFSQPLQRWYRVEVHPDDEDHFITLFSDISEIKNKAEDKLKDALKGLLE